LDTNKLEGIKSLYKFKTFDDKYFYQDLLNNILYFPVLSQLNDPYTITKLLKFRCESTQ